MDGPQPSVDYRDRRRRYRPRLQVEVTGDALLDVDTTLAKKRFHVTNFTRLRLSPPSVVLHRLPTRSKRLSSEEARSADRLVVGSGRYARLFSQVRGLTMSSSKPNGTILESVHEIQRDHSACRAARVCRTAPRIPQLTHRTFLLSLYRSTRNSSYIRVRGGLGDRLAEGVRQMENGFSMSPQPDVHNEVPCFEGQGEAGSHPPSRPPARRKLTDRSYESRRNR